MKGAAWWLVMLRRIVTSYTVAGRREHKREDVGPADWPAILDEITWRRLRSVILNGDRSGPVPRVLVSLAGIVRCAQCGSKLRTWRLLFDREDLPLSTDDTQGGCGGVQVVADPVDELITAAVISAVDTPVLAAALTRQDRQAGMSPTRSRPSRTSSC